MSDSGKPLLQHQPVVWFLLSMLIFVNLVIAYFTPGVLVAAAPAGAWQAIPVGLLIGACASQLNLISVWCALAPGRFVVRFPWALGLLALMWYALILGNRIGPFGRRQMIDTADAVQLGLVLFVSFAVVLAPIYIASAIWGWRLESFKSRAHRATGNDEQFSLGLLLAGTAFASVLLALGRLILPPGDFMLRALDGELLVLLPVMAGCNLVLTLPSLWVAFAPWRLTPVYVAGCMGHCLVVTALELTLLGAALGVPPPDAIVAIGAMNFAQFLWVFTTMILLRCTLGFELTRIRRLGTTPFAESPFVEAPRVERPERPALSWDEASGPRIFLAPEGENGGGSKTGA